MIFFIYFILFVWVLFFFNLVFLGTPQYFFLLHSFVYESISGGVYKNSIVSICFSIKRKKIISIGKLWKTKCENVMTEYYKLKLLPWWCHIFLANDITSKGVLWLSNWYYIMLLLASYQVFNIQKIILLITPQP